MSPDVRRSPRPSPPLVPHRPWRLFTLLWVILPTLGHAAGLLAPAPSGYVPEALLLTSDPNTSRVRLMDPARGAVVFDFAALSLDGARAGCAAPPAICQPMGVRHSTHNGQDYLDIALTNVDAGSLDPEMMFPSMLTRIVPSTPFRVVWQLRGLDFRDAEGAELWCEQDPAEEAADASQAGCDLQFTHAFSVVDDRPEDQIITLVTTDVLHERILQVTLDYAGGNTIGHVDWILGANNPDWPTPGWPNAVQYLGDEPGGPYLLVTLYSVDNLNETAGQLRLYRITDTGLEGVWTFPEEGRSDYPYLHAPHMGQLLTNPATGERWIWYSHGRGMADAWGGIPNEHRGGSYGLLEPGARLSDPPTYLGDLVPFPDAAQPGVLYARDVDYTPGGDLVLTDAACESLCAQPAAVYRYRAQPPPPESLRTGIFTPDHTQQELRAMADESLVETYRCGYKILFESQWIPSHALGSQLRQASRRAMQPCPGD